MRSLTIFVIVTWCVLLVASFVVKAENFTGDLAQGGIQQTASKSIDIVIEAETATLAGPMKISPHGQAFNNLCINGYTVNRRGWATFTFTIPEESDYIIWGRILGRDGYSNSFFVSVDGAPDVIWDVSKSNNWDWLRVTDRDANVVAPLVFRLTKGVHTIRIGNREKETLLDRLIITNDQNKMYYDYPARWIRMQAPAMADVIAPGSVMEFKWNSLMVSGQVNIDLSFDLGKTFSFAVIHGTENDGSHVWQVPAFLNKAKVIARVSDAFGGPYDVNRGYFSIVDPAKVSLTLTSPNGGEKLVADNIYVIRWKEFAFNGMVQIFLSTDNGATWTVIADNQNAAGENYWLVTPTFSTRCLIKIADAKDGTPWDISNANFSIVPAAVAQGESGEPAANGFTATPVQFGLENYPNPFNPQTTLKYSLTEAGYVTLKVYDMLGREAGVLIDGYKEAGVYQVTWNAVDWPTGLYTAVLQSGAQRSVQRLTLVK